MITITIDKSYAADEEKRIYIQQSFQSAIEKACGNCHIKFDWIKVGDEKGKEEIKNTLRKECDLYNFLEEQGLDLDEFKGYYRCPGRGDKKINLT